MKARAVDLAFKDETIRVEYQPRVVTSWIYYPTRFPATMSHEQAEALGDVMEAEISGAPTDHITLNGKESKRRRTAILALSKDVVTSEGTDAALAWFQEEFGKLTLLEIGLWFDISRERVRQITIEALNKLRLGVEGKPLPVKVKRGDVEGPLTFNGVTESRAAWAKAHGIDLKTLNTRLNKGWDLKRALTTPKRKWKKRTSLE